MSSSNLPDSTLPSKNVVIKIHLFIIRRVYRKAIPSIKTNICSKLAIHSYCVDLTYSREKVWTTPSPFLNMRLDCVYSSCLSF